jgi:negative regulator of flagellin synthesis FlgM
MRIENRPIDVQRGGPSQGVEGAKSETASRQAVTQTAPASRSDKVQISDAGRALAAQIENRSGARESLSAERVAEIRQRIFEGAYNSVEVVEQVARRMLQSGDI